MFANETTQLAFSSTTAQTLIGSITGMSLVPTVIHVTNFGTTATSYSFILSTGNYLWFTLYVAPGTTQTVYPALRLVSGDGDLKVQASNANSTSVTVNFGRIADFNNPNSPN